MDQEFTTITVANGGWSRQELSAALTAQHIAVTDEARALLQTMPVYPGERPYQVPLGLIPVAALGLTSGASQQALLRAAQHYGLGLVPLAAAVAFRLQWQAQPVGRIMVASPTSGAHASQGFYLENTGSRLVLRTFAQEDQRRWPAATIFAFELLA